MKIILTTFLVIISTQVFSQEEKIIYEYKKYEKFDLGDLEIKGQLIAPGDLSVRERERKRMEIPLFHRNDVFDMIQNDNESLH
jgi:hypothetical protein